MQRARHRLYLLVAVGFAVLVAGEQGTASAGWFKKLTGHRTPEPIRRIAPNGIQLRPLRPAPEATSGSSSASSVNFTVVNQSGVRVSFQVKNPGNEWSQYQLDPGRSLPFRFEVWGGYGSGGSWSDSSPQIQFQNGIGNQRLVTPANQGTYYFQRSGNAIEISTQSRPAGPPSIPQPPNASAWMWRGVYNSRFGRLTLSANGNVVSGTIAYPNGTLGHLNGRVQGDRLIYDWWNNRDRGHGELVMAAGGNQLQGWFVDQRGQRGDWFLQK